MEQLSVIKLSTALFQSALQNMQEERILSKSVNWVLIVMMLSLAFSLHAQSPSDQILIGYVVKQTNEGVLVEGRIVNPSQYRNQSRVLVQNKSFWLLGWKDSSAPISMSIAFFVTPNGETEKENGVGVKEAMTQLKFIRDVIPPKAAPSQ